uniref:Uncharacterized protein n=1 Tax=Siphoviridae sp. ctZHD14 TaxID=2827891 RepID=A0A8S5SWV1_9CAUD|nr:MAG TPA: hypothetical protein [Siphoviridae sp. ctZHD14]
MGIILWINCGKLYNLHNFVNKMWITSYFILSTIKNFYNRRSKPL